MAQTTKIWKLSTLAILIASACYNSSIAQETDGNNAEQTVTENESEQEIIEIRGIRGAIYDEQSRKRDAEKIIDGISAEDIGKLPDENVTEAVQRVPGVQIERDAGEGTSIAIRGLPQNRVEIGGIRLVSPIGRQETGNPEEVSILQAVPSALLSRIEVAKSPTADMVEGSLGGTVSLELRKPLELGNKIVYGLGMRSDERTGEWTPNGDFTFSKKSDDDTWGGLIALTFQDRSLQQEEFNNRSGWRDRTVDGQVYSSNIEMRYQEREESREQRGVSAIVQYKPNMDTEYYFTGLYADFSAERERDWFAYSASGSSAPSYYEDGTLVTQQDTSRPEVLNIIGGAFPAQAQNNAEDYTDESRSYNMGIGFEHSDLLWTYSGALTHGFADRQTFQNFVRFRQNGVDFVKDYSADIPTLFLTGGFDPSDLDQYTGSVIGFVQEFTYESDETAIEFDATRILEGSFFTSVETGIRYTTQTSERESFRSRRRGFDPAVSTGGSSIYSISKANFIENFGDQGTRFRDLTDTFGGNATISGFIAPDPSALGAARLLELGGRENGLLARDPFTSYATDEDIIAVYGKLNFEGNGYYGNFGIRALSTSQSSDGFAFDPTLGFNAPVTFDRTYSNILPSANITFEMHEDVLFRFALSRVMSRPSTLDLSFSTSINETNGTGSIVEADRQPLIADSIDVSLEWYIDDNSSVTLGLFHKDVSAFPVDLTNCEQVPGLTNIDDGGNDDPSDDIQRTCAGLGEDFFEIRRNNNADGIIRGAELASTYVLENGLGARFNYTYIDSRSPFVDPATEVEVGLPNLSKNSLNLTVFYESGPIGVRAAYNWRDEYLRNVNFTANNSLSQEALGQLVISGSYDLSENLSLTASVINVTDEQNRIFNLNEDRPMFYTGTGRRFLVGIRGRL